MRQRHWLFAALAAVAALLHADAALAQYKNSAFGFDAGGWLIQKPSVVDENKLLLARDSRPVRLANGVRLGGETNVKMSDDHFWLTFRVNVGGLSFPAGDPQGDQVEQFDAQAKKTLGTLLGVEGQMGVRYVFLTDRFRPYAQGALSYVQLMSFNSLSGKGCAAGDFACDGATNEEEYLPHRGVGVLHGQVGAELVFKRDMAIHAFVDVQRWVVWNAADNNAVVLGFGFIFFT